MKKFNVKVQDREFIIKAKSEEEAVKKLKDACNKEVKDSDYVVPEQLERGDMIVGNFGINFGRGTEYARRYLTFERVSGNKYYFKTDRGLTYETTAESIRKARANWV